MDEESMQHAMSKDKWLSVAVEANELVPSYKKKAVEDLFLSTILVLVGTSSGQFGLLDIEKGCIDQMVRSHCGPVRTITCLEDSNLVVTTSNNCEVSLWEIYPHAKEDALSEVMRFEADSVPSLVCRTSNRLCIAANDHQSATYSITMYDIEQRGQSLEEGVY
jgi:WD40 repeat protein